MIRRSLILGLIVSSLAAVAFFAFRSSADVVSAVRERLRQIARVDVSAELQRVNAPILYLQASHDRLVPTSAAEQVVRIAPHTKVVEIEGPHLLLQCVPKHCAEAIREFVTSV